MQALETQLAAEKDQKKAAELKKLCAAGVKKIFDSRLARENTRLYLRRYTVLTNEGTTLLATEDKTTSAVLGGFLARLQELAASEKVETLVAVGKSAAEFMKALIEFKA